MSMILAVAAGGAAGAVARYLVSGWAMGLAGGGFPVGTVTVNVLGSVAMGILIEFLALRGHLPLEVRGLIVVGFLGAFTTFSTFALDVAVLHERGAMLSAFLYIVFSVVGSVGGLFLAMAVARRIFS
ncbi:MAG: fluoride efflux transporter CrcB [Alphaproteobacteria bacterium]|nr:fluoride efflux transporter CrcB [Alphaproteobacteria bacterium]